MTACPMSDASAEQRLASSLGTRHLQLARPTRPARSPQSASALLLAKSCGGWPLAEGHSSVEPWRLEKEGLAMALAALPARLPSCRVVKTRWGLDRSDDVFEKSRLTFNRTPNRSFSDYQLILLSELAAAAPCNVSEVACI